MGWRDTLNEAQRAAAEHGLAGEADVLASPPLLVIAGAGTGKTMTLAHRVAALILAGVDPGRILLLTFSRRAAREMEERVARIVAAATGADGRRSQPRISWSGTFHAIGARLLRMHAEAIGLSPTFTIHDREDSADLINLVRHELKLSEQATRFPLKATCLAIYSRATNARAPLDEVLRRHFPWCAMFEAQLAELFEGYVATKQLQNVLDYDDLLLWWAEMLKEAAIVNEVAARFDHVLVDEYQDTNPIQAEILHALKPDGRGLTVVGDDAQAIYGFRAADVRNILDFPAQFSPPARVVKLEENYRATTPLLDAANAVMAMASEGYAKTLRAHRTGGQKPRLVTVADEIGEVGYVVETVLAAREMGVPLKEQAVLFRTSHHSAALEVELTRRNIPYVKFGGLKFLDSAHVKDVLAVLRWVENPADRVSGFRILQLLPGVGPATAAKILDQLAAPVLPLGTLSAIRVPAPAGEAWRGLADLIERLQSSGTIWPAEAQDVRDWYQPILEQRFPDALVRAGDLDQLVALAGGYRSRQHFLTELTLDPPDATSDEAGVPLLDEDYLILSTIHSAKGQEWRHVHVLKAVDGCLPSDMATGSRAEIEEERRLLYVAMTRAKDELSLMLPLRFYVHNQAKRGDGHVYASRTRFIPPGLLDRFVLATWPRVERTTAVGAVGFAGTAQPAVDLASRMRGRWMASR